MQAVRFEFERPRGSSRTNENTRMPKSVVWLQLASAFRASVVWTLARTGASLQRLVIDPAPCGDPACLVCPTPSFFNDMGIGASACTVW